MTIAALPIDAVLPALCDTVRQSACVVLSAAPGAGKTTRVPLALLQAGSVAGRIIVLEPRRLAALRAAQYMAQQLDEKVGETVGYRMRGDSKVSARTKIEVVTEGVLTRLIQNDPELGGVGLVIFDEFHERSLHADFGLALVRDSQKNWRDDLKLLVMSATLDGIAISALLDNAPIIVSEGRSYPVEMIYLGRDQNAALESRVVQAVMRAVRETVGDILVFLPGLREIRRTQQVLENNIDENFVLCVLHGEAALSQQQAALQKNADGKRKIILSTSIAETSLTIDGVRVVIDAGLARSVRFDPRRGMSGLVTLPVSQATAEQRAGRAGRQQSGWCYRLWSEEQHAGLARFPATEILRSDLMPLAMELAQWGVAESQLDFLDAPPVAHLQQARERLQSLGALDSNFRITAHGHAMAALPVHPRYANMLLRAQEHGLGALACEVAALLDERDVLRGNYTQSSNDADLYWRWQALKKNGAIDRALRERIQQQVQRLRALIGAQGDSDAHEQQLGLMLALCYPERVARRRDERGERWQLASGVGASLPPGSALAREAWIAIADLDGEGRDARVYLAAALNPDDLSRFLPELFFEGEEVLWSPKEEAVIARSVQRFGALILREKLLPAHGETVARELCRGLRSLGWSALPQIDAAQQFLQRVRWVAEKNLIDNLPDFSENYLLESLEQWLAPYLLDVSRRSQLSQVDIFSALQARLDFSQQQQLDRIAPTHIAVPTGSRIALDYSGEQPVLPVRIQEMFGAQETPRIAGGKIPVLIHLLSPRQMPLAVTQDLASFWQNAYKEVRKDMRGQYPKHYWPENPLEAEPTRRTKAADDRAQKIYIKELLPTAT